MLSCKNDCFENKQSSKRIRENSFLICTPSCNRHSHTSPEADIYRRVHPDRALQPITIHFVRLGQVSWWQWLVVLFCRLSFCLFDVELVEVVTSPSPLVCSQIPTRRPNRQSLRHHAKCSHYKLSLVCRPIHVQKTEHQVPGKWWAFCRLF